MVYFVDSYCYMLVNVNPRLKKKHKRKHERLGAKSNYSAFCVTRSKLINGLSICILCLFTSKISKLNYYIIIITFYHYIVVII